MQKIYFVPASSDPWEGWFRLGFENVEGEDVPSVRLTSLPPNLPQSGESALSQNLVTILSGAGYFAKGLDGVVSYGPRRLEELWWFQDEDKSVLAAVFSGDGATYVNATSVRG